MLTNNIEATDYNSIHCPELGDADKQFSELYKEFNELIELNGQGLFETTQDLLKKHDIGNNIDDLDDPEDIQARVLEIEHRILPKAVALYCDGKIVIENERAKVK